MPRKARQKHSESIYHIMCRSVSEVLLFRDDLDKKYYLELLKRYKGKFKCSIYAFCLMNNHVHLHFDPKGFDVSKFMHSLNVAYVRYYNKKYKRHGHVFQERFESRILDTDEYNLTVSAYIHNNPMDLEGYSGKEELYPFSSFGIYLGVRKDYLELVDMTFIMDLFNTREKESFAKRYMEFANYHRDLGTTGKAARKLSRAIENEYKSGRQLIIRDKVPAKVISYISNKLLKGKRGSLYVKSKKRLMDYRSVCAYALRVLCGLSYSQICANMFNITVLGCSNLCNRGYELVNANKHYSRLLDQLACANL